MRVKEKIEKAGYFWMPTAPDKKIPGVLHISDGGAIELEVVGLFDESIDGLNEALNGRAELGRVVGHVETYGLVTLDGCFYRNSKVAFGGIAKSSVYVNKALLGVAYDENEVVLLNEFTFSLEGIDEWVGISGIKVSHDRKLRSSSITFNPPQEISISLENGMRLLITFHWTLPGFPVTTEAKITQKTYFKLTSEKEVSLPEFISVAYKITTLMCFAIDRTVCVERVIATSNAIVRKIGDEKTVPAPIDIYYSSLPYDSRAPKIDWRRMLFRYPQIKDDAERIINNWLAAYETIDPALNLYFSVRTGTHKYLDSKFLALAQGLETLHRRTSTETMLEPEQYEALKNQLVLACPEKHKVILPTPAGHPVKRISYATEVSHDQTSYQEEACPQAVYA